MYSEGHSIPISISVSVADVLNGILTVEGLMSYADRKVVLELQLTGSPIHTTETVRHELCLRDLQSVEFKRRVIGSHIRLESKSLVSIEDLPGVEFNRLGLSVSRKYRDRAQDLVTHIQIDLSEMHLADFDSESDTADSTEKR